jgi:hypothetical protein
MTQRFEILSPVPAEGDPAWGACYVDQYPPSGISADGTKCVVKRRMGIVDGCGHDHGTISIHHHPRDFEATPEWSDGSILTQIQADGWRAGPWV